MDNIKLILRKMEILIDALVAEKDLLKAAVEDPAMGSVDAGNLASDVAERVLTAMAGSRQVPLKVEIV